MVSPRTDELSLAATLRGYRGTVREVPALAIPMQESGTLPPMSQSAATTSLQRNNLSLLAQQIL